MVSKIAVMALVAVVAVPILLGYGLNINTEDRQVWAENDDPINVKDYLVDTFDAAGATYVDADIYKMNSNVFYRSSVFDGVNSVHIDFYPDYTTMTSTNTSLPMAGGIFTTTYGVMASNGYSQAIVNGGYDGSNYYTINIYTDQTLTATFDHVKTYTLDGGVVRLQYLNWANNGITRTFSGITQLDMVATGTPSAQVYYQSPGMPYIDLTKGFRLNSDYPAWSPNDFPVDPLGPVVNHGTYIDIAYSTRSVLLTMDLSTVTESDTMYQIQTASSLWMKKTTTDGIVKWEYATGSVDSPDFEFKELYYNPLASSNTYQLYLDANFKGEFRYVGAWPDVIGSAPAYLTYSYEFEPTSILPSEFYERIASFQFVGKSPVMRIDEVRVAAYNYMVMQDAVYDPSAFRSNPITTIDNPVRFGQGLEFGGVTYIVNKGNITIGTHDFSLNGMTFESVQVGGQYENRINGNLISTTAEPSTITFYGKWLTDIITESQSMTVASETKWMPGQFSWDGVDTNFKMAGLLASLGAFIALAIYGRRFGAKVLPLLLVCGGAALMFLVMI